ncbi:MAG: UDP-glucose/GDP-mannose dehydrogenase family protein [Candidatus Diapherotrites archaeon]|nr:UDP-glucose/GDP-mannose dehydrogenase family protein [Candidatus Diapherotrites archaeon]
MRIAMIGTGYVGLVTGTCLAQIGHNVVCVDIDEKKIKMLKAGICPIYEPQLEAMIRENLKNGRLKFTTDTKRAVQESYVVMIAVCTPQTKNGKADLSSWKKAACTIAEAINEEKVIVNKSTVPVGTAELLKKIINARYKGKFYVVSNPEFLREGNAVNDFMKPDRIVVGYESTKAKKAMQELYRNIKCKKFYTDLRTAELIKYASNALLAIKISFINEIAMLCDKVGANVVSVSKGVGMDRRIGPYFLNAGCGWGGSCFPKDVSALVYMGKRNKAAQSIARAAHISNERAKLQPVLKLKKHLGKLNGKKIALLGLSFKPNTDDVRSASSLTIIGALKKEGAIIRAYDPAAMKNTKPLFPDIRYCKNAYDATKGADAIIIITEWREFANLDYKKIHNSMKKPLIIDGRNLLNRKNITDIGFVYEGIGV